MPCETIPRTVPSSLPCPGALLDPKSSATLARPLVWPAMLPGSYFFLLTQKYTQKTVFTSAATFTMNLRGWSVSKPRAGCTTNSLDKHIKSFPCPPLIPMLECSCSNPSPSSLTGNDFSIKMSFVYWRGDKDYVYARKLNMARTWACTLSHGGASCLIVSTFPGMALAHVG